MTVYILNYREPQPAGVPVINTTTRSKDWSRNLSPMLVGPVMANGIRCHNVENAWQFSKVYEEHVEADGTIKPEYFKWRDKGYRDTWAHRYPAGKGRIPLFSLWNGNRLKYIDARASIYIPIYASAVVQTDAFSKLKEEYQKHGQLVLLDFDAYDHRKLGLSWEQVINNPTKKMGHAFVLAMLLEGVL